jgi:hypothetical protein
MEALYLLNFIKTGIDIKATAAVSTSFEIERILATIITPIKMIIDTTTLKTISKIIFNISVIYHILLKNQIIN